MKSPQFHALRRIYLGTCLLLTFPCTGHTASRARRTRTRTEEDPVGVLSVELDGLRLEHRHTCTQIKTKSEGPLIRDCFGSKQSAGHYQHVCLPTCPPFPSSISVSYHYRLNIAWHRCERAWSSFVWITGPAFWLFLICAWCPRRFRRSERSARPPLTNSSTVTVIVLRDFSTIPQRAGTPVGQGSSSLR